MRPKCILKLWFGTKDIAKEDASKCAAMAVVTQVLPVAKSHGGAD